MPELILNGQKVPVFDFRRCRECANQRDPDCMPPDDGTVCPRFDEQDKS